MWILLTYRFKSHMSVEDRLWVSLSLYKGHQEEAEERHCLLGMISLINSPELGPQSSVSSLTQTSNIVTHNLSNMNRQCKTGPNHVKAGKVMSTMHHTT